MVGNIIENDLLKGENVEFSHDEDINKASTSKCPNENLSCALKTILNDSSSTSTELKLLNMLEKREAATLQFQKKIIEIEKDKLECLQKYVENKEKQSIRKYMLLKDYINNQVSKKRKFEED